MGLFRFILSGESRRDLKKLDKMADKVFSLEEKYKGMTDAELISQTQVLKDRLSAGETLDDILYDAFAVVREASYRVLKMRHYKVQVIGGICLHQGRVAEMKTGEGKTLVATLPAYLNALTGKGVHIVTVNDYLAARDAEWMGKIYRFLGLTVGVAISGMQDEDKQKAYACDITYGTNNEMGFDYLRDNLKSNLKDMVQRGLEFAIVDEVDSILIDEARTPLIISGKGQESSEKYISANRFVKTLKEDEDFTIDIKEKSVQITDSGAEKAERFFRLNNFADIENAELSHHIQQALKANYIFKKDNDYVVSDGEVIIVDEFTGRLMIGRRYSDGLHQAIEAKEHVEVQPENQTVSSISYQNLFRMYPTLAGMTGTAMTEAAEFEEIYKLRVVSIPTNKPVARIDHHDEIYRNKSEKYDAIIKQIAECMERKQPVLVGTVSIEKSEELAKIVQEKLGIKPAVLNAKHHESEAKIVSQAGAPGAVTIATNMAGRGTDIKLGGNAEDLIADLDETAPDFEEKKKEILERIDANKEKVLKAGGLYVIGTERHESRRIDNQLRGRSGRQGDPGDSKFFLFDAYIWCSAFTKYVNNFGIKTRRSDNSSLDNQSVGKSAKTC